MTKNEQSFQHLEAEINKQLWLSAANRASELNRRASDAVEAMLKTYLSPAAFDVLKTFQLDDDRAMGCSGMTFLDALDDLGHPDGLAELQRTLRRIKKKRECV